LFAVFVLIYSGRSEFIRDCGNLHINRD